MLCIFPTSASSASLPSALRSVRDTAMFLPPLIVGKAFSCITGRKRPIKEQRKSKPGEDFHRHKESSQRVLSIGLTGFTRKCICGRDSATTCVLICPSSVSIVRAGLTASEKFKKVDSALSFSLSLSFLSLSSHQNLRVRERSGRSQYTATCPFLGVKLTWLPELLC